MRRYLTILTVCSIAMAACAHVVREKSAKDLAPLSAGALLEGFLKEETSRGDVKFVFQALVDTGQGQKFRFKGFCGYRACDSLRVQCVGPLGFTMLDYLHLRGEEIFKTNRLMEGENKEKQEEQGHLNDLMRVLTAAFLDHCYRIDQFQMKEMKSDAVSFGITKSDDQNWLVVLDKRKGVLLQQVLLDGSGHPRIVIDYERYRYSGKHPVPRRMTVQIPDEKIFIDLKIKKWILDASLPENFFSREP